MKRTVADVCHRQKHIPRQFALDSGVPRLNVRNFTWIAAELPQEACGIEEAAISELLRSGHRNASTIPLPVARNVSAKGIRIEDAAQQAAIINGYLVVAIFIRTPIKEIDRVASQNN